MKDGFVINDYISHDDTIEENGNFELVEYSGLPDILERIFV
jgi:hypothetical protein